MVGIRDHLRYHCFMEGLFDFIDTTTLWKDIQFTPERHHSIMIRIDIQLIDIRYTNLWTDQQAYIIRARQLCGDLYLLLMEILHSEADCYASGGSHLRAGAYTVRGKMSRRDVCARVLSDGIGRKAENQLLLDLAGCNKGMSWGRRCSACSSCRC